MEGIKIFSLPIHQEMQSFITSLDLSPETRRTYRSSLIQFADWIPGREGSARELVLQYKAERLSMCSSATVTKDLASLRAFCAWLMAEGRITQDPTQNIKSPKTTKHFKRGALTLDGAKQLVESTDDPRDSAILALMLRAGLRDIEVERALVTDLKELNGGKVLWVRGKGRTDADEFVVINDRCSIALDRYLASASQLRDSLFGIGTRQIRRIVTGALERCGLKSEQITAHSLRHTAATLALEAGVPLSSIQAMLRHKDPRVTANYAHVRNRTTQGAEHSLDF